MGMVNTEIVGVRDWTRAQVLWWVASGALAGAVTAELSGVLWLACLGWLISGLFLGVTQGGVLRRSSVDARGWTLVTVVATLVTAVLLSLFGVGLYQQGATFGEALAGNVFAGALGGLTLGLCQYALLRGEFGRGARWIAASVLGVAVGSGVASLLLWFVYGSVMIVRGTFAPALLAAGLLQGGIYGAVTAAALPALLRASRPFARR